MSEKRHRLYTNELPEVISGLLLRLEKLTEVRKEEEKAKIVYRTLFRLIFVEGEDQNIQNSHGTQWRPF